MSEMTQTQTLEQTLNKTDFGHILYENRKLFFGILATILLGISAFLVWQKAHENSAIKNAVQVFEFQSKTWADAKAGKIPTADLVKAFEGLSQDVRSTPIMLPVALEMGKFLYEKAAYAEAEIILSQVQGAATHPVSSFFISMQRSVVLEKLGKIDEATALLEKLAQTKEGLLASKVSLELGRLYLAKGDKGKAQTQFDYVLNTYPNDDAAKMAKLYVAKLTE